MTSEVVLHTVATGAERVVFRTDALIEAPNWSPCGGFLVVNGAGRVFRLDLAAPDRLHPIDTGDVTACNNDHGLSPDGRWLAVCNSPGRGTALIYIVPVAGGAPRQVTPRAPSWFHGFSPDGGTLVYAAVRDGEFQICTCPVAGGAERVLTTGPGHKDGPDYTPDGAWIWFNSDHAGRGADLWRIRPDGTDLERMTDDDAVNWFPHPAPDGGHVLYLAYPPGTQGHPRDLDVTLRMMPATGGAAREVAGFRGGQGSLNVPCWAPDAARFAYVRYPAD